MDNLTHLDVDQRFKTLWRRSLADSGHTQSFIANAMGVSRQTVARWLNGEGCPTQKQGFEWFAKLGLQPLPYYLDLLYPDQFNGISSKSDDERISKALHVFIDGITPRERRLLFYCCYGEHGSSPHSVLEMLCAYLHMPQKDRLSICNAILEHYELAAELDTLIKPDCTQPDIEAIRLAVKRCRESVLNGQNNYTSIL